MSQIKLAVSLHTISRNLTKELIDAVIESGIHSLEILSSRFDNDTFEKNRSALKNHINNGNLKISSIHLPFGGSLAIASLDDECRKNAEDAIEKAINDALDFNAGTIVVHASAEPIEPKDRKPMIAQGTQTLKIFEKIARENSIKFAIELLPRTCIGNTSEELFQMISELDKNHFGICLDVNHLMENFDQLPDEIRKISDSLFELHISDYDGIDEKHWMPGQGVIDWKELMKALDDIDFNGLFNYEAHIPGDSDKGKIEQLEKNFKWLSNINKESR